ncbi:flavin reductase like domain-containing protein [Cyathus striatus]|nr:flavin reductase like domain-containing protein [Cyathus striatus]
MLRTRPSSLLRPPTHSFSISRYSTAASTKTQPLPSSPSTPTPSSTTHSHQSHPHPTTHRPTHNALKDQLRALLRATAQPVAVITSLMPRGAHSHFPHAKDSKCRYHGATLSSFSSISMDPYPLVSFALRIPSRMAVSLGSGHASSLFSSSSSSPASTYPSSSSSTSTSTSPTQSDVEEGNKPIMTINLLSQHQPHTAHLFSRPDLHPEPFSSVTYTLSRDGLPVLDDSLAAITCELVGGPIPLHDLEYLEGRSALPKRWEREGGGISSELFIARVIRVEDVRLQSGEGERVPLIYYQRGFTYCHPEQLPIKPTNTS